MDLKTIQGNVVTRTISDKILLLYGPPATWKTTTATGDPKTLLAAYEIGYRAGFGKLSLDASAYYNKYEDFIGNKTVVVPLYGKVDFSDIIPLPAQLGGPTPAALIAIANTTEFSQ